MDYFKNFLKKWYFWHGLCGIAMYCVIDVLQTVRLYCVKPSGELWTGLKTSLFGGANRLPVGLNL